MQHKIDPLDSLADQAIIPDVPFYNLNLALELAQIAQVSRGKIIQNPDLLSSPDQFGH